VRKDGSNLEYASKELKGNKEVVMAEVQQDGSALEYASDELNISQDLGGTLIFH
jgi:hypothetical protein